MQIGLVFPQNEMRPDVGVVRAFSEGVEELGYTHVLAYGGCTRAGSTSTPRARLSTSRSSSWLPRGNHEGGTRHRRPRVATASDTARRKAGRRGRPARSGRFRLGVGHRVEWRGVRGDGQGVFTRGRRLDEQLQLLRLLWSQPSISFEGAAGIGARRRTVSTNRSWRRYKTAIRKLPNGCAVTSLTA
jgi:hypothetical protein